MQKVEGSNPFIRSMILPLRGDVAEWLRHGSAKPATPVQFRSSPPQHLLQNPRFPPRASEKPMGSEVSATTHMTEYAKAPTRTKMDRHPRL
jgi:hypothetical protein